MHRIGHGARAALGRVGFDGDGAFHASGLRGIAERLSRKTTPLPISNIDKFWKFS
jgi:hypothetical protein